MVSVDATDRFRVDYSDPSPWSYAGWHRDDDHLDLGSGRPRCSADDDTTRRGSTFDHETPSLLLREPLENP